MAKTEPKTDGGFKPGTTHAVSYIEFTSRDDADPIYKVYETKHGMWTVAHYATFTPRAGKEDAEGPRGSVEPGKLRLLVHAFGGDPSKLPDDDLRALSVAERLIREADKEVDVIVGDKGYIRFVRGMHLPGGEYLFSVNKIRDWSEGGQYGVSAPVDLEVVSYADGSPCSLKGAQTTAYLPRGAMRMLYALFPSATTALLGKPSETLERLQKMAIEENENRYVYGKVAMAKKDSKRPSVRRETLKAVPLGDAVFQVPQSEKTLEPSYIKYLYDAINDGVEADLSIDAFQGGKLVEAAKDWCREHFADIVKSHQTVTGHEISNKFVEMSQEDVVILLTGIGRKDLVAKVTGATDEEDEGGWG